jgi:hypothetical protein
VIDDQTGEIVPLLASWRFGNGQVLALASHGAGQGTAEWMKLPEYPLLWAQAIKQFLPGTPRPGLNVDLERDSVEVVAEVLDEAGAPLAGLSVSATIAADGESGRQALPLTEIAPGRYQGEFAAVVPGTHLVSVTAGDRVAEAAVHVAYPARYDVSRAAPEKLVTIAAATGGAIRSVEEPLPAGAAIWAAHPNWRLWVLVVVALFMLDLTLRYAPNLFQSRRAQRQPTRAIAVAAQ